MPKIWINRVWLWDRTKRWTVRVVKTLVLIFVAIPGTLAIRPDDAPDYDTARLLTQERKKEDLAAYNAWFESGAWKQEVQPNVVGSSNAHDLIYNDPRNRFFRAPVFVDDIPRRPLTYWERFLKYSLWYHLLRSGNDRSYFE